MEKKLKKIFIKVFGSNIENSIKKIELNVYPNWDSLRHMSLIMEIEKEFKIKIPNAKILELKKFNNFLENLLNK